MSFAEMIAAKKSAAQAIIDTAETESRPLTDDEQAQFDSIVEEAETLQKRFENAQKNTSKLKGLSVPSVSGLDDVEDKPKSGDLATRFVEGKNYQNLMKSNPDGFGSISNIHVDRTEIGNLKEFFAARKAGPAIDTDLAKIQNVRFPTVDKVSRPELTLLDLISRGETAGSFEYLQITAVQRNAAIVKENSGAALDAEEDPDVLKPISGLSTNLATAKVFDYADGYIVTNQLLADAPALASFLNRELQYSLSALVEDMLLNGTGSNGQPTGLLNTSGVQSQEYTTGDIFNLVKAIRKSMTKISKAGGSTSAILLSPEDNELIDLYQDNEGRFFGGGPFGQSPQTLWGRPRAVSQKVDQGTAVVGDFSQIALLDRSGISVTAFNQHEDFARRNLTYVRAELRAAQAIWKPAHLAVVEPSS